MLGCKEVVEKKPHAATATVLSDTVAYVAPVDVSTFETQFSLI